MLEAFDIAAIVAFAVVWLSFAWYAWTRGKM